MIRSVETHVIPVTADCRFLLHLPDPMPERPLLALVTHGYGMNPTVMLQLALPALGPGVAVASIEAPHQFYLSDKPGSSAETAYNWGTAAHWQSVVRVHHDFLLAVQADCKQKLGIGSERTVLLGFSQPVGLNYRFAATHPDVVGGIIGVCGGLPRDWEDAYYQAVNAAILHISRTEDEYYSVETVRQFPERLRLRAKDVEFHLISGRHRFPSQAGEIVKPWLARVFGSAPGPASK